MLPMLVALLASLAAPVPGRAPGLAAAEVAARAQALYPELGALYRHLHAHPELSFQEAETTALLAERLRGLGFEVTTGVGKTGLVGVLRNGPGSTLLLRTDMDALPVAEATGLPYASTATARGPDGSPVPVMHACGHDVHMSVWLGTASVLATSLGSWRGTLVLVGQPAEEVGQGAAAVISDGLLTRFPRPDFALAIHDMPGLPAGSLALSPGPVSASSDSVDLRFFGRGGHGAFPHQTVDPIVLAARFVLAAQTLVSRENDPLDPAVVSVGSIHAGAKHNVIPDVADLQLTLRAYRPEVRERLLSGIRRLAEAEAAAAAAPRAPEIRLSESLPPTVNDEALARRVEQALRPALAERLLPQRPMMGAEDFARYGREGIPSLLVWLGTSSASDLEESRRSGRVLPSLHSPRFAPEVEPTLVGGVTALSLAALELLR